LDPTATYTQFRVVGETVTAARALAAGNAQATRRSRAGKAHALCCLILPQIPKRAELRKRRKVLAQTKESTSGKTKKTCIVDAPNSKLAQFSCAKSAKIAETAALHPEATVDCSIRTFL
jgi:hypothetical protein